MKALFVILSVIVLTGCAEMGALKQGFVVYGALAADESRLSAERKLCNTITVGAWGRAYGKDPVKADAWRRQCGVAVSQ